MGREVKRVALDFEWPLDKVWKGYIHPAGLDGKPCEDCSSSGQHDAGWWLQRFCQRIDMLASDVVDQKRARPMHPWLLEDPYPHTVVTKENGYREEKIRRPSEDIIDLLAGISGRPREDLLSPLTNTDFDIFNALVAASGIEDWANCKSCNGTGYFEEYEGQWEERDNWKATEPPAGEGWQLWETVSEGSPVTPVFETAEGLINWLSTSPTGPKMNAEHARKLVSAGWAPSLMVRL